MNKKLIKLILVNSIIAGLAGCSLEDVNDGDLCPNAHGTYADDYISERNTASNENSSSDHCSVLFPHCLETYCAACPYKKLNVQTDDNDSETKCLSCEELESCHTQSCDEAWKRACSNTCKHGTLYAPDGQIIRECEHGCSGTGDACKESTAPECSTGEILTDDQCVCDAGNHWKGAQGNCTCEEGYHADGNSCVKDSNNCSIGKILNAENECICDTDNGWTKASDESDECICAKTHLLISGSCVKKLDCGKGEILNEYNNTCICDNASYWGGIAGNCACLDGYEETDGICQAPINCSTGEFYDEKAKKCECDTLNGWTGDSGKCICQTGYQLVDGKCTQIICKTGAVLDTAQNACTCDTAKNWTGDDPENCLCQSGYLKLNGQCEKETVCNEGAVLDKTTNTCACDTANNWSGDDPANCSCKSEYLPVNGKCEEQKTCSTGAVLNRATNTCACDTANNWSGDDPEKCECDFGYKKDGSICRLYQAGEIFTFGNYYKKSASTKEPIEWVVLEYTSKTDQYYLLLSKYGLDVQQFNDPGSGTSTGNDATTWENSSLNTFMNDTFYKVAFSDGDNGEKIKLLSDNDKYRITLLSVCDGGLCAIGTDTVFLTSESERIATPTPYAESIYSELIKEGLVDPNRINRWWLSDVNLYNGNVNLAIFVSKDGVIATRGADKVSFNMVRPVIRVKINK